MVIVLTIVLTIGPSRSPNNVEYEQNQAEETKRLCTCTHVYLCIPVNNTVYILQLRYHIPWGMALNHIW